MPRPQLPWFRFWKGATQHPKVRMLTDAQFRTWVELLDLASQQKERGRFLDRTTALRLSRRPARHLEVLQGCGLLDCDGADGHLTMHDWDDWQRWRAGETGVLNDPDKTRIKPGYHPDKNRETSGIEPAKNPDSTHNGLAREERAKIVDKREEINATSPASQPGRIAREGARADLPDEVRDRLRRPPIGPPAVTASPQNSLKNARD